jgi:hypothetical protein
MEKTGEIHFGKEKSAQQVFLYVNMRHARASVLTT